MYHNYRNSRPMTTSNNKICKFAKFASLSGVLAGIAQPELIAMPVALLAFILLCLPGVILLFTLQRATSYFRSRQAKKQLEERVELQSIGEALENLEGLMWKTKHIPLMNLVSTFLTADSVPAKVATLLGIWQLYTERAPSVQMKQLFEKSMPLFTKAVESACRISNKVVKTNFEVVEQQSNETSTWYDQNPEIKELVDELFIDDEKRAESIEKHRDLIVVAAAATAFLGALIPATIVWKKGEKMSFSKALIEHGRCITAKNIIWNEVTTTKNNILWLVWKLCGKEYIPKTEKTAIQVQELALQIMKDLREYEVLMNSDFFGSMRSNKLITIERAVKRFDLLFKELSQVQKSQYNLTTVFTTIRTGYEDILKKRIDLIMNATGKQDPVVVHLAGDAGHGKSEFMKELVSYVEKEYGITTYYRNVHEEHWSHFGGQQVLVWDDIGFSKEGKEYIEFCYHTAGAPSSATGAAIADKGKPTNPLFIFLTSNHPYLGPQGHSLSTPTAFHRRRDVLIHFKNTKAEQYMANTGSTIPSHLYDAGATVMSLLKPVPQADSQQLCDNTIGFVTKERLFESIVEMEKQKCNHFKASLRVKPYYTGTIPDDVTVDHFKISQDFLVGKPRVVAPLPINVLLPESDTESLGSATSTESLNKSEAKKEESKQEPEKPKEEQPKKVDKRPEEKTREDYPPIPTRFPGTNIKIPQIIRDALEDQASWSEAILEEEVPECIEDQYMDEQRNFFDMCDDGEYENVELQAVDPIRVLTCKKTPVFLISGPSGIGKSHVARMFGVDSNTEFHTVLEYTPVRKPDTIVILDDITLSAAAYTRAVEIANVQYEQGICKAMVFTENALKRNMFNSQLIAEMRRRSHTIELNYKNPWWRFWVTWDQLATEYKAELSNAINKEVVVRKNVHMVVTEYAGKAIKKRATDVLLMMRTLIGKTYGDDHIAHDVWTLPMPSEIDFRVALSKNFSECSDMTAGEAFASIFTGKLFQITNITNRFTVATSISMVRDVFKQAPAARVGTLDSMVMAFNDSNVQSAFRPPGVAVITTPEGAVGLCWRGTTVRMFRICSDPVELDGQKIDVHKYFNPHVESVYKNLLEKMSFTEESVKNTDAAIQESQYNEFKKSNIFCVIFECFISVVSISAQIMAPVALAMNTNKMLKEKSELKFLRASQTAANRFVKSKLHLDVEPMVRIGSVEYPIVDFERSIRRQELDEEDVSVIVASNPQLQAYFNHTTHTSKYPHVRHAVRRVHVASFPTLEALSAQTPRLYTAETYAGIGKKPQKGKPSDVQPEAFASVEEYDEWVDRTYGKLEYEDEIEAEDRLSREREEIDEERWLRQQEKLIAERERINAEIEHWAQFQTPDDWAADESREKPTKQEKPVVVKGESREKPTKQEKPVVVKGESREKPTKQEKPVKVTGESRERPTKQEKPVVVKGESRTPPIEEEAANPMAGCRWYTNVNSTIVEASRIEKRPGEQKYVYMRDGAWDTCNGEDADVAQRVKQIAREEKFTWAVFTVPPNIKAEVLYAVLDQDLIQLESTRSLGDILRVRRKVGPYTYWHYGVVGPSYAGRQDLCIYHVQSNDVDGFLTAYIAVDPVAIADNWEVYYPEVGDVENGAVHLLKKRKTFDHLIDHAYEPFAYNSDQSNCETWALAMVYEDPSMFVRQVIPKTFLPLLEISKTFLKMKERFAEVRQLQEDVTLESCVDPTALSITRNTLPNSQVMLFSGSTLLCRAIGLKERYVLSVAHVNVKNLSVARWLNGKLEFFDAEVVKQDDRLDLAIYEVTEKRMPAFKDITGYFMTINDIRDALAYGSESLAVLSIVGKDNAFVQSYGCKVKGQLHEYAGEQIGTNGIAFTSTIVGAVSTTGFTEKGDCGSPLILFKPQLAHKIIGIHRAGSQTTMYASPVPQEWLKTQLRSLRVVHESRVTGYVEAQGVDPDTGLDLVGYSNYRSMAVKGTKIRENPINSKVFPNDGEPAIISPLDPRAPGYNPALTTLRKFKREAPVVDMDELNRTADELVDYLAIKLHGKSLRVFSTTEAINGPSRMEYPLAGQIDRSTSAGFPQTQRDKVQSKAQYFQQYNVGSTPLWKIARTPLGDALRDDLSAMIGVAKAGKRPDVVFSYFPKDEVLKQKKIVNPNTRGILSGNVPYVLAYRKYFLALHLRCQEIYKQIPIKIGINSKSFEWHELADYHLRVSNVGFDADAKNWDASIPLELMQICSRVVNGLYKRLDPNWTELDDTVRTALHSCVESPKILYDGKIVQPRGGQVSGQPGTAFDNSLINWIMCAIIFKRTMKAKGKHHLASFDAFMKHTAPSFYGDDMLITLSGEVYEHFGLSDYVREAATFGIEITPADKDSEHREHMKLSEMTFLKRGFKKIGVDYVGPIERASIAKAIKWLRGFGTYVPTEVDGKLRWKATLDYGIMRENFENQLIEAALHGESDFTALRTEFNELLDDLGMDLLTISYNGALAGVGVRIE